MPLKQALAIAYSEAKEAKEKGTTEKNREIFDRKMKEKK